MAPRGGGGGDIFGKFIRCRAGILLLVWTYCTAPGVDGAKPVDMLVVDVAGQEANQVLLREEPSMHARGLMFLPGIFHSPPSLSSRFQTTDPASSCAHSRCGAILPARLSRRPSH